MKEFDVEKDLSINKFRLDEECLSHSSIYFNYAEAQQDAKSEVSKADDALKLTLAEREMAIRKSFADDGVKTTEAMVNATVAMDSAVLKAKEILRNAQDVYNRLTVAVQAMDARRSEIDNLVKLYVAGYFSMPNGNDRKRDDVNEQASKEIRKNLNKGKKE